MMLRIYRVAPKKKTPFVRVYFLGYPVDTATPDWWGSVGLDVFPLPSAPFNHFTPFKILFSIILGYKILPPILGTECKSDDGAKWNSFAMCPSYRNVPFPFYRMGT